MAGQRTAVILVSLIGLVVLGIAASGLLDAARVAQLAVNLMVPVTVMFLFWRAARRRILEREAVLAAAEGLEGVANRATGRFLAGIAHELTPHPERCNLRDEVLVVAVDYQDLGADVKVVVPDLQVSTDPNLLRQILHVMVGNAIRHGGDRVAIWAAVDGETVRLAVSDDGPGLPEEIGDRVFERYVDLAEEAETGREGSGLAVANALGERIGAQLGYKRDPSWTHFMVSLPLGSRGARPHSGRFPLRAGVG
ncbi:MAG TPA: sensor histidine kinase [Acidimicrobiia bacterium]|nr:sensor histidine kinase [Acidimicrobiia bacterium]